MSLLRQIVTLANAIVAAPFALVGLVFGVRRAQR